MEVAATNRSGNRLPQSILKNLSTSSQPDSTFEMLLDMPTASASYIKPTADDTQLIDETTASVTESSVTKKKPRDEKKSEPSDDKQSDGDDASASLAVTCLQTPNSSCNLPQPTAEKDTDAKKSPTVSQNSEVTQATSQAENKQPTQPAETIEPGQEQNVTQSAPDVIAEEKPVAEKVDASGTAVPVNRVERVSARRRDDETSQKSNSVVPQQAVNGKGELSKPEQTARHPQVDLREGSPTQAQPVEQGHKEQHDHDRPAKWYERDAKDAVDKNSSVQSEADLNSKDTNAVTELSRVETSASLAADFSNSDIASSDFSATSDASAIPTISIADTRLTMSAASGSINSASSPAAGDSSLSSVSSSRTVPSGLQRSVGAGSTASATGSDPAQPNQPVDISRAEKARMVQRVARSFSRVGPMGGNVNLKLHPPELGALAVQVKIEGKSMSAKLTTESSAAREVILESLPQLRNRLAEQGFDVQLFTVDVASDGAALGNQTGQDGAGQGSGTWLGGQSGNSSDSSSRSTPPTDLRRSSYLRRQLDSVGSASRPTNASYGGRGVDITA
ncbi:MAG: flagellar hook-length control protein FliK [Pirellulales bacterium]